MKIQVRTYSNYTSSKTKNGLKMFDIIIIIKDGT